MQTASAAELRAFDAAAHTGSMSGAALLLGIRQPTVSAHVARLEQDFGVELFLRRGRGVELTPFGRMLHEVTHRIYRAEEQASLMLLAARSGYEGHLRLCAIGPYNVVPMLRRYRTQHPRVLIAVDIGDSRQTVERVLDSRSDVGVLLHAVADERVFCQPYRRQPLVVFAAVTHPLAGRPRLRLEDLQGQEFVLREHGSQTRRVFEAGLAQAGLSVRASLEIASREAVREAVAQGLGLGVVARTALVPDPRLVILPIVDLDLCTEVHVICLRERMGAPLVASFLETVARLRAADAG